MGKAGQAFEQPQHGEGIQPDKDYGDGKKVVMDGIGEDNRYMMLSLRRWSSR